MNVFVIHCNVFIFLQRCQIRFSATALRGDHHERALVDHDGRWLTTKGAALAEHR